jgi:hypothetical protein
LVKRLKEKKGHRPRRLRRVEVLGMGIFGFLLIILWTQCIWYFMSGHFFGHKNYYGQPVGTFLLVAMLMVFTLVFFVIVWRILRGRPIMRGEPSAKSPSWMEEPPFKWPWQ